MNEDKYDEDLVNKWADGPDERHVWVPRTLARMARAQRERAEKAEAERDALQSLVGAGVSISVKAMPATDEEADRLTSIPGLPAGASPIDAVLHVFEQAEKAEADVRRLREALSHLTNEAECRVVRGFCQEHGCPEPCENHMARELLLDTAEDA